MLGILSGPCAFEVFIPRNSFSTPLVVMRRGEMGRLALFFVSGRFWSSSREKTDWHCSTRICAYSLQSLTSWPIFFSGDTPTESWRLDLTYRQKGFELFSLSPCWMTSLMWFSSACLKAFLQFLWKVLNELHWLDFLAYLYSLDFRRTILFKSLLNQGRDFLFLQILEGMYLSMDCSMPGLNMVHKSSTVEEGGALIILSEQVQQIFKNFLPVRF